MPLLLPEEIKQLVLALQSAFPSEGELDDLTWLDLGIPLRQITPSERLPEMIKRIIARTESTGNTDSLITAAMARAPGNPVLQAYGPTILRRLAEAQPAPWYRPPSNPYETCFVPGPRAFVSRRRVRDFARDVAAPLGAPILIINGLTNTGKSYSFQLLAYVRRAFQEQGGATFALARIDLKDENFGEYPPEALAKDIAGQAGWNTDSMPKRPSSRYVKELCQWLVGQSNQRNTILIIVLDGFHHPKLYGETREMAQELIRQVSANTSNIRLLMLNFPDILIPPNLPTPVQFEDVAAITTAELTDFFSLLYQHKGRTPEPTVIDAVVKGVLTKVSPGAANYNEQLNQKVTEIATELK